MRGKYKYRKRKVIDQVLSDYIVSDYFDRREGQWWQPVLNFDYPTVSNDLDQLMNSMDQLSREIVSEYHSSKVSQRKVAENHGCTRYKVRVVLKGFQQRVFTIIRMI